MPISDENGLIAAAFFKEASLSAGEVARPYPFQVSMLHVNDDGTLTVSINRLSFIYDGSHGPAVNNLVPWVGKNIDIKIRPNDSIWMEIFYNRNGTPWFGIVKYGADMPSERIDMIQKGDITSRKSETDEVSGLFASFKRLSIDTIKGWTKNGRITKEQEQEMLPSAEKGFSTFIYAARNLQDDLNYFFDNARQPPSSSSASAGSVFKRQFRSYIPIARLVSPPDPNRKGDVFELRTGRKVQISQQLDTNLILVDSLHDNTYMIKVPIPFGANPLP